MQLRSASEIKMAQMKATVVATQYLVRPFQLMMEPAVFFINLYVGREFYIFIFIFIPSGILSDMIHLF